MPRFSRPRRLQTTAHRYLYPPPSQYHSAPSAISAGVLPIRTRRPCEGPQYGFRATFRFRLTTTRAPHPTAGSSSGGPNQSFTFCLPTISIPWYLFLNLPRKQSALGRIDPAKHPITALVCEKRLRIPCSRKGTTLNGYQPELAFG